MLQSCLETQPNTRNFSMQHCCDVLKNIPAPCRGCETKKRLKLQSHLPYASGILLVTTELQRDSMPGDFHMRHHKTIVVYMYVSCDWSHVGPSSVLEHIEGKPTETKPTAALQCHVCYIEKLCVFLATPLMTIP